WNLYVLPRGVRPIYGLASGVDDDAEPAHGLFGECLFSRYLPGYILACYCEACVSVWNCHFSARSPAACELSRRARRDAGQQSFCGSQTGAPWDYLRGGSLLSLDSCRGLLACCTGRCRNLAGCPAVALLRLWRVWGRAESSWRRAGPHAGRA